MNNSDDVWVQLAAFTIVLLALCTIAENCYARKGAPNVAEEDTKNLIVMIEGALGGDKSKGAGIIFGVGSDELFLITANHVVRRGEAEIVNPQVWLRWMGEKPVEATLLVYRDVALDIAVLKVGALKKLGVDAGTVPFYRVGDPTALKRGDDVYFIGNPGGNRWWVNVTPGKFAYSEGDFLRFESTLLAPGYSGGALVDEFFNVLGMTVGDESLAGRAVNIASIMNKLADWKLPVDLDKFAHPKSFQAVAAGLLQTCGLASNGLAYCWTTNDNGKTFFAPMMGSLIFKALSAGDYHTCGVTISGKAYCWGANNEGQLGDGSKDPSHPYVPVAVSGDLSFKTISAGYEHTCGISSDNKAYCWGAFGASEYTTPQSVRGNLAFESVSAGHGFSCGVTTSGKPYCWGDNNSFELGNPVRVFSWDPVPVHGDLTVKEVRAGVRHACAVTTNAKAYCWGESGDVNAPVTGDLNFRSIATGDGFTCGVTTNGKAYCWGENDMGELGDGSTNNQKLPVSVSGGLTFKDVSASLSRYACGLTIDGAIYCWGNVAGPRGTGRVYKRYGKVPTRITSP